MTRPRKRLAFVVAEARTAITFLSDHMRTLSSAYDIALVGNSRDPDYLRKHGVEGDTFFVPIHRPIAPFLDGKALVALRILFRRERFDAVHSITPKAGLLAMAASRSAGVPLRTHTFTGQVWATLAGPKRDFLRRLDQLNHRLSTYSLVDSWSQRQFLINERVVRPTHSGVLGAGSIAGVDVDLFSPDPRIRESMRQSLGYGPDDVVCMFLGRLKIDKGVLDLAQAFAEVTSKHSNGRLLIVGPDEENLTQRFKDILRPDQSRLQFVGLTFEPETYMAAADIFCLPSYREGFGSVLIEAAAANLPSVASNIYGISDAVVDGETGLLHPPRDIGAIAVHLESLIESPELRTRLGACGRARALAEFSTARLTRAMLDYYLERLPPDRPPDEAAT